MIVNFLDESMLLTYRDCCLQAVDYIYLMMKYGKSKYMFGRYELCQTSERTLPSNTFENCIVKILDNSTTIITRKLQIHIANVIAHTLNNLFSQFLSDKFYDKDKYGCRYFQIPNFGEEYKGSIYYHQKYFYIIPDIPTYIVHRKYTGLFVYDDMSSNKPYGSFFVASNNIDNIISYVNSTHYFKLDYVIFKMTQKMIV